MDAAWKGFMRGSAPGHAVQIYRDASELAQSAAGYLAQGFDMGEPAIVIATQEHWPCFAERLAASGWGADRIERQRFRPRSAS